MKKKVLLWLGAVFSAVLASFCCIVPLFLTFLGLSSLGFGWGLIKYRPYFLISTFVFLGLAFYFTYKKREIPKEKMDELSNDPRFIGGKKDIKSSVYTGNRRNKIILWAVTVLALVLLVYPHIKAAKEEKIREIKQEEIIKMSDKDFKNLAIVIVGASCCNPAFAPLDKEVEQNVKKVLKELNIPANLATASISEILFKGRGGGLSPEGVNEVRNMFGKYNLRAFPMVLVNNEIQIMGGVPTVEQLKEKLTALNETP